MSCTTGWPILSKRWKKSKHLGCCFDPFGPWMKSEVGRKRAVDEVEKIVACVKNGLAPDFEL